MPYVTTRNPQLPWIELQGFKPSCMTVIEGSSGIVPEVLYLLCVNSVASSGRDAVFVDGWNSFNPYALSRIAKSSGIEPRKILSRIHVARAFTEYQMGAIIGGLQEAIERWNPAVLAVAYLTLLFSGRDGKRLLSPALEHLRSLTASSSMITAITSFGGSWYCDRLLASSASRVIRIEEKRKLIRVIDDGNVFDYMPVPLGQRRFTEFTGGDACGQNSAFLSHPA